MPISPFRRAIEMGMSAPSANCARGHPMPEQDVRYAYPWTGPFLDALQAGATVTAACAVAGVHASTVYDRRIVSKQFRKLWNTAIHISTPLLEGEAVRRAYHGTDKPVYQRGVMVGTIREYSDTLLTTLLKARRPDRYRDRHGDDARGPMTLNVTVVDVGSSAAQPTPVTNPAEITSAQDVS